MKTSSIFRRATLAILPATVLFFSACSKDDDPVVTPVDQGRIYVYHGAPSANVAIKFLFDDVEKSNVIYGQNGGYQTVNTGIHTLRINNTAGTTLATQQATVEKDKSYSYFAFSPTTTTVGGLFVTDDLTAPSANTAKIRLVHLGQGSASPLKISSTSVAGLVDVANINVVFAGSTPAAGSTATVGASSFVEIPVGTYNLAVTTGSPSLSVASVGDGSGSGTGTKAYEAGKIYTVVLRGTTSPLVSTDLQPKAILIQNN